MIKINTSGDYVQLIYVDPVQESVQQELKSDTDAFECSYDSEGKLYMQFGLMRFENPDPTDFTINGSAVTDAADFISKLNALFTGGGGGGFPASISQDTEVDLAGNELSFTSGGQDFLSLSPEQAYLASTPDGDVYTILNLSSGTSTFFQLTSSNNSGSPVQITGDGTSKILFYDAGFQQFNGINEFVDDAAAAAGGVPVNGLYHSMGTVKIRLS